MLLEVNVEKQKLEVNGPDVKREREKRIFDVDKKERGSLMETFLFSFALVQM